jgi:3-hydroxybutyryl-CoA dehydrogenase
MEKVCILGSGQMGCGIAQIVATAGYPVTMIDNKQEMIDKAQGIITESLDRFAKKDKIKEDPKTILDRIKSSIKLEAAADADILIEAVYENADLKRDLFKQLDQICPEKTIFMSNTSQFSITLLGAVTNRRDRFIGTHWFNPAVLMRLIEVVRGLETSDETLQSTLDFCNKLGKETVVCRKDVAGFITTRFIWAMRIEAIRMLDEGLASAEEIDKAIKLSLNYPMGPFEMMDFGHLDLSLQVVTSLYNTYGERFLPPQSLKHLVNSGHLGRRHGRGWLKYDKA